MRCRQCRALYPIPHRARNGVWLDAEEVRCGLLAEIPHCVRNDRVRCRNDRTRCRNDRTGCRHDGSDAGSVGLGVGLAGRGNDRQGCRPLRRVEKPRHSHIDRRSIPVCHVDRREKSLAVVVSMPPHSHRNVGLRIIRCLLGWWAGARNPGNDRSRVRRSHLPPVPQAGLRGPRR